jgi:hypothetical protein
MVANYYREILFSPDRMLADHNAGLYEEAIYDLIE